MKTSPRTTLHGSITVALMLGHGQLTCVYSILTSCSELSRRAVSPAFALHSANRKPSPFLAVTHAVLTNWEYMDVIRLAADTKCSSNLVNSITTIDSLLKIRTLRGQLKKLFGLGGLASDQDFVSVLTYPLDFWQNRNWDPAVGSTTFDHFCATLNGDTPTVKDTARMVHLPGGLNVNVGLLNYAKWIRENVVSLCPQEAGLTMEECFGTSDATRYQVTSLVEDWRLWVFQYCTQWGYLTTAPPGGIPRIISHLLDIDYEHKICVQAFPPGKHYAVPPLPNITAVNSLGGFHIEADRLAFIDGEGTPMTYSSGASSLC
jgi:hypothetical protein